MNSYNAKQLAEVMIHFLLRMAPPQAYCVPRSAMTATIHGQEPRLAADPPVTNLSGLSSSSLTLLSTIGNADLPHSVKMSLFTKLSWFS